MIHILIVIDKGICVTSSDTPIHYCIIVSILSKFLKVLSLSGKRHGGIGLKWTCLPINEYWLKIQYLSWMLNTYYCFPDEKKKPLKKRLYCLYLVYVSFGEEKKMTKISQCRLIKFPVIMQRYCVYLDIYI